MAQAPDQAEVEKKTRAALETYVDAWARGDRDQLLNLFAEDATWYDPAGAPPWQGRANIGKFWDSAHQGDATLTPVVDRIVACGNEGLLVFRMEVRSADGSGMNINAFGKGASSGSHPHRDAIAGMGLYLIVVGVDVQQEVVVVSGCVGE